MNKGLLLSVAHSARADRLEMFHRQAGGLTVNATTSWASDYEAMVGRLSESERCMLLRSLSASLEKERRRCKARKWNYDAGRHISLYIAVKTLAKIRKQLPA